MTAGSLYARALRSMERSLSFLTPSEQAHLIRYLVYHYITDASAPPDPREANRRRMARTRDARVPTDCAQSADTRAAPVQRKVRARAVCSTSPEVGLFFGEYVKLFEEKYTAKPRIVRGKDGAIVRALVQERGYDKCVELLRSFFASEDDFIRKSGHSIGVFSSQINKLLAASSPNGTGPKRIDEAWKGRPVGEGKL